MKILFVGLCAAYSEGMTYQDNLLTEVAAKQGHEVVFISNAEKYINGVMCNVEPCDSISEEGIRLIRVPYIKIGPPSFYKKLRAFSGIYSMIEEIRPDVIFCHNHHYLPVLDVIKYKKCHPQVLVYADSHVTATNSASNWISLNILHKQYYRFLTKKLVPYLEKYYYIGEPIKDFSREIYGVPEALMEYLPLGGTVYDDETYNLKRSEKRKELGVLDTDMLYIHTGKMDKLKRTKDLLISFSKNKIANAKLIIIGNFTNDVKDELLEMITSDNRISYLGWKQSDELMSYLCASDVYCQPGSPSATMQNAICCRNVIMTPYNSDYDKNIHCDCYLWCSTIDEMASTMERIGSGQLAIDDMRNNALRCAKELLDYNIMIYKIVCGDN